MGKSPDGLKQGLARVTIVLLFLCMLTSATTITQVVKAQNQTLSITPTQGPVGTEVNVYGTGFDTTAIISISFDESQVATTYANSGIINVEFTIPSAPPGTYFVTAMDLASYSVQHNAGLSASATFTVTSESSIPISTPTTTHTSTVSSTPAPSIIPSTPSTSHNPILYPTYQPPKSSTTENGGFWSPLTIGIIAAVLITFFVPTTILYSRYGKRKALLENESPYRQYSKQEPPATPNRYTATTPYNQSPYQSQQQTSPITTQRYNQPPNHSYSQQFSKPSLINRPSQPQSYNRQPSFTKICPHCKKSVRDDLNICPNCDKRLK